MITQLVHKNIKPFSKVCRNSYGRKMITTNYETVTSENVLDILEKSLPIHNQNRREIDYLYNYVSGDQPILYRTKDVRPEIKNDVVENHALEIVRFMTAQSYGEPIQYVSASDDEKISEEVDKINKYMASIVKSFYDIQIGDWQSTCGTAYRETWSIKESETRKGKPSLEMDVLDPRETFIVYSSNKGKKPMLSVSVCQDEKEETYYLCTSKDCVYTIKDEKITKKSHNGYGRLLIVEYPNNIRRLSDVEIVITMLDAMNNMQSNRMDGIEQFVQAFVKFVNCEIDEDTFLEMCKIGALSVKTVNPSFPADVGIISSQLDQQDTQVAKDDIYKNMLIIEGMPSREQNTGGDTGQAVYLRNGWDFAEQRAKIDEPVTIKAEKEFIELALDILHMKDQISKDVESADIDIKITRNQTDNMLVKAQALVNLLTQGISPKIAIRTCGLWGDPEKVYLESKPFLDVKYKTLKQVNEELKENTQKEN